MMFSPSDDSELLRIAQSAYGPLLLFARQWDETLAEDAVQAAIMELCRTFRKGGQKPDNAVAWLFQVVRNELKYRLRQRKTHEKHADRYAELRAPWFVPSVDAKLDAETVVAKLAELPLETREVIVARIWGDLSFEAIANLLDMSHSTVHRRYVEGLEELKKKVKR